VNVSCLNGFEVFNREANYRLTVDPDVYVNVPPEIGGLNEEHDFCTFSRRSDGNVRRS